MTYALKLRTQIYPTLFMSYIDRRCNCNWAIARRREEAMNLFTQSNFIQKCLSKHAMFVLFDTKYHTFSGNCMWSKVGSRSRSRRHSHQDAWTWMSLRHLWSSNQLDPNASSLLHFHYLSTGLLIPSLSSLGTSWQAEGGLHCHTISTMTRKERLCVSYRFQVASKSESLLGLQPTTHTFFTFSSQVQVQTKPWRYRP